ncbi:unnamed protein product, partial [marine sediment metagenome]
MKFLVSADNFFAGLQYDIVETGHEWYWWTKDKPTFDVFDEVKPDVLMTTQITPSILKCLNDNIVVIIYNEKTNTLTVNDTQLALEALVDTNAFKITQPSEEFACEVACVGKPDDTIRKLCYPIGDFHVKIFGDDSGGGYGLPQYLGRVTHEEECQIYASALFTYIDNTRDALKVIMCGGHAISTNESLEQYADIVDSYKELTELIEECRTDTTVCRGNRQFIYASTLAITEHTYQHLAILLLEII